MNSATGNFLEREVDLGFAGGCGSLVFERTYNSLNREIGGFGRGWSSWTEAGLVFTDDAACWVLADGRQVVFPRLGAGWDRSTSENYWLVRVGDRLVVRDNSGGSWVFDAAGRLVEVARGAGTGVALEWQQGRLVGLRHERGRSITLEWSEGRVSALAASDGRRVEYGYDDAGRLVSASGPLGVRSYRWDAAGLIAAVVDADGVVEASNTYDQTGRVTSQMSAFGRITRYGYLPGRVTVVSDADGTRSNTWIADPKGRLVGIVDAEDARQSMACDRWGNLVMVTGRDGSTTLTEYDDRGRRVRQVTASGADLQWGYDEADRVTAVITEAGAVTTYRYAEGSANPSEMVDPTGGVTRMEWAGGLLTRVVDPAGVAVEFGYDQHGDLISTTDAQGNTARLERDPAGRVIAAVTPMGQRTSYAYHANGTLASRRNPDGGIWRYEHSPAGRLTAVIDPLGGRTEMEHGPHGETSRTIDPLGRAVTRRLDDLGNLAAVELPDGSTWQFSHDAVSRLRSTVDPSGAVWTRDYDADGGLVRSTDPTGASVQLGADPSLRTVSVSDGLAAQVVGFDPLGRPLSQRDPVTDTGVMTVYDRCGRPVEVLDAEGNLTRIERDRAGRVTSVISPTGLVTGYGWDECGRLTQITSPAGALTTRAYNPDGHLVAVTAPTGETSRYSYDPVGRLVAASVPGAGVSRYTWDRAGRLVASYDTWNGQRRFRYDLAGQLVETINGNAGSTGYGHDECGRITTLTNPDGGTTHYQWDASGRLVAETDPLGRTTRAGYDQAGRQTWQQSADGHRTEWAYDPSGRIKQVSVDGQLVSSIERDLPGRTVTIHDHTDPNRPSRQQLVWNASGQLIAHQQQDRQMAWTYDAEGRRTSMTGPGGTTTYHYTPTGELDQISHPLLGSARFAFDPAGRLVHAATSDQLHTWAYTEGWLTSHTTTNTNQATSSHLGRDADGRITHITTDGETVTYSYDQASQLTNAGPTSWTYDPCGRITTQTSHDGTTSYSYDQAGQLLASTNPAGTTTHDYDQAGRRTHTHQPDGNRRDYEWTATGWLAGITDHTGDHTRHTKLRVDAEGRLTSVNNTPISWDIAAPVPTLAALNDVPVVNAGPMTGIGENWNDPGWRTARTSPATQPWQPTGNTAPGQPAITNTGGLLIDDLEWLGARPYHPASHSFLTVDPLTAIPGAGWAANPYSYAGNNPIGQLDPTGLHPVTDAELKAYAAANQSSLAPAFDWVADNWEYLAGGAMVIGGGVLIATGVGGPVGMMLVSAGADTIIQKATTGTVDWGQVAISGALGGFAGAGAAARLGFTGLKATVAAGVISGGTGGAASGAYGYATGPGPHTVQGFLGATAASAAMGGLTGGIGAAAGHGLATIGGKLLGSGAPNPLFRGDSRDPSVIFSEGFGPSGTSTDLFAHAANNSPSVYVSTSKSVSVARDFASQPPTHSGWVYQVAAEGVDVNKALGSRSPFPFEREVAIPGGIEASEVVRAREVSWGSWLGDWVDNPNHGR